MSSLSDLIEQYLRELLARAESIEIQRRQLARMFRCVPSQINYVLETRFTIHHGYLVRRRGAGIHQLPVSTGSRVRIFRRNLMRLLAGSSARRRWTVFYRLVEEELLGENEAALVQSVIQQELTGLSGEDADTLWARLLRVALLTLCHQNYPG